MGTHDEIESLVTRAQQGDRSAFEAAIASCRHNLEGFVQTRLGRHLRQEIEVEDVLQETYTQALTSISRFSIVDSGSFLRWLNGIAEHVILGLVRKSRDRQGRVLYVEQEIPDTDPTPSRGLRREERLARLQKALSRLPPDYRQAIYLVRIEGLTVKDVAERLDRTPKAIMHLLARGLKQLRENFGDTESLNLPPEKLRDEGAQDEQT